jgi:hypothetical protein
MSPDMGGASATPLESLNDSEPDWSSFSSESESEFENGAEELPEDEVEESPEDENEAEKIWAKLRQEIGDWYGTVTAPQGEDEDLDPIAALQDLPTVSQWLSEYHMEIIDVATQAADQDDFIAKLGQDIGPQVRQEIEQKTAH